MSPLKRAMCVSGSELISGGLSMKKLILIAGLIAGLSAPAFATNYVVDGDFSNPNLGGGWSATQGPNWYNHAEWGVETGYSPIYGLPTANAVGQSMELDYNTFGDVVQTVSGLTVGKQYVVSYLYGGRTGTGLQQMDVYFGGAQLGGVNTAVVGQWTAYSFLVTATATSQVLEFTALNTGISGSLGNEITNVAVSAPEASTWAMMLAGFVGLGFVGYRRQKASFAA
jgi:hypothetical protein